VPERSTIYEVARRSGVSTATVSRVMHNGSGFSAATRERVLAVAAELDWVPATTTREQLRRRAGVIGVLFPDLAAPGAGRRAEEWPHYVDQVILGAERAAAAAGAALLIAAIRGAPGREIALSVAAKVDALLVLERALAEADVAALSRRVPVAVLSDRSGRRTRLDSVGVDNRGATIAVVEHLIRVHGHRDLVFLGGPRRSPDASERFAGFRHAMRAARLTCPAMPYMTGEFTEAGGARAVRELLADRQPPHAIVCANDEMAVGALAALAERGLAAPADVAVTGFDGLAITAYLQPPLTTVEQPMREIGAAGVRAALARIADPLAPRHATVLPTRLVVRRSCGCGAANE
jgi:LacI family transcriptional regulator